MRDIRNAPTCRDICHTDVRRGYFRGRANERAEEKKKDVGE